MDIYFISNSDFEYPEWVIRTTVEKAYEYLKDQKQVGFDTETRRKYEGGSALDPYTGEVILIQLGTFERVYLFDCTTILKEKLIPILSIISSEDVMKVGTNLKFDYKMCLGTFGIKAENLYDSQVVDEVIYNGLYNNLVPGNSVQSLMQYQGSFSLASQVKRHLKVDIDKDKKGAGRVSRSFITFQNGDNFTNQQLWYAANDIKYPLAVKRQQLILLKQYSLKTVAKLECEVVPVLGDIEYNGINIDKEAWKEVIIKYTELKKEAEIELDNELAKKIKEFSKLKDFYKPIKNDIFGEQILTSRGKVIKSIWDSPVEVLNIFRTMGLGNEEFKDYKANNIRPKTNISRSEQIKLAKLKKLAKGMQWLGISEDKIKSKLVKGNLPSSSEGILLRLVIEDTEDLGNFIPTKPEHKIVALLLKYREYNKAINTYGEKFLARLHPVTGRIHTTIQQLYPETGRISSTNPNLTNIKAGSDFRNLFVAGKENEFVITDYTGQELVLIAEGSGDSTFIEAFTSGKDVHSLVASILYKKEVTKDNENKELRKPAKNLNFGLAYGMGADKLAAKLGCGINEAKELMQTYYSSFPAIKKFLDTSASFARYNGYSETYVPFKRVRWYKDHKKTLQKYEETGDYKGIARIERQGKNTPIQGSGADMVKQALVYCRKEFQKQDFEIFLRLTVHDEIISECNAEFSDKLKVIQEEAMIRASKVILTKVPMKLESNISKMWKK